MTTILDMYAVHQNGIGIQVSLIYTHVSLNLHTSVSAAIVLRDANVRKESKCRMCERCIKVRGVCVSEMCISRSLEGAVHRHTNAR
jgi:hypothetical protein